MMHVVVIAPVFTTTMFCCSVSQMVVDTICVVRSQNTSECLNQDVLFLGTSESTVAVFLGWGGGVE